MTTDKGHIKSIGQIIKDDVLYRTLLVGYIIAFLHTKIFLLALTNSINFWLSIMTLIG